MDETPFFKTRMGATFYEHTFPALVEQMERLNKSVERLADGRRDPAVHELVDRAVELAAAAEHVLDVEIVPGSEATLEAFGALRANAVAVRRVLAKIG